jgi:predicted nucleic acid-binding protein
VKIFIDTSAWDAIEDRGDPNHELALAFKDDLSDNCRLITTDYVLDETYTLLLLNVGYERTIAFQKNTSELRQTGILAVVHVTSSLCDEAWDIFKRFNVDKKWSFTDCVSYVVMKQLDIETVFAFDYHFEQMGFNRKPETL